MLPCCFIVDSDPRESMDCYLETLGKETYDYTRHKRLEDAKKFAEDFFKIHNVFYVILVEIKELNSNTSQFSQIEYLDKTGWHLCEENETKEELV